MLWSGRVSRDGASQTGLTSLHLFPLNTENFPSKMAVMSWLIGPGVIVITDLNQTEINIGMQWINLAWKQANKKQQQQQQQQQRKTEQNKSTQERSWITCHSFFKRLSKEMIYSERFPVSQLVSGVIGGLTYKRADKVNDRNYTRHGSSVSGGSVLLAGIKF